MLVQIQLRRNMLLLAIAGLLAAVFGTLWAGAAEAAVEDEAVTGALSAEEAADLDYMREEEKLARDLYLAFYELYGSPAFRNIAAAEQRHMESVLVLLTRYELGDPATGNGQGVFDDPDLAALYEGLLAEGSASLSEALRVAAAVEEIDILDLQESLAGTDKVDISRVYRNLLAGSVNHLRAYSNLWERQTGQAYAAQTMEAGAYEELLGQNASQPGQRRGVHGAGRRQGRGAGTG